MFRPKSSVRSRKVAIAFTFIRPLYKESISIIYRVFYIAILYIFTTSFQRRFYLRSTPLIISIVDFYLYQWPPILYRYSSILLVQRQASAQCANSPYILFSFLTTYRQRASQLVYLGVLLFQGTFAPRYILFSIQRMFSSTRQPCTITALYIAIILIHRSSSRTTTSRSSIARSILLQAPIVLRKYQFYSLVNSTKELFTSSIPFSPRPQIQALYNIIGLTITIYSRRIRLNEGPYIKTISVILLSLSTVIRV